MSEEAREDPDRFYYELNYGEAEALDGAVRVMAPPPTMGDMMVLTSIMLSMDMFLSKGDNGNVYGATFDRGAAELLAENLLGGVQAPEGLEKFCEALGGYLGVEPLRPRPVEQREPPRIIIPGRRYP